jgi:class 3 adenylate cyclase/tetratricopeptide (TPR) repeat protein
MGFFEILARVTELLQRERRVSYRAIKREWHLDDASIEDLKAELIEVRQVAVDQDGKILVWAGGATSTPRPTAASARALEHTPLTYTPSHLTEKILIARHTLEGERKQVTVLFADIKGSTELIEGLDPEEARQLLDPAIHIMMDAVHRYEGTVNQVLGDGIMALFGAPLAHEDHALRACYAALAMQAAMQRSAEAVRRSHGVEVRIRIGLNSGEVVVRAIGNDLHMDYSAVGQTTHLAARMEQLAPPGSIRLTAATLRLVEGLVQVNALGPVPVKGLTEPVEVFELVGTSSVTRRLQATAARGLTRFVGRQHEIEVLYQAMDRAGAGHGQVVALVGEPGVGKSRLVYEFIRSHRTSGWLILESASASYGKATAYFPVSDLLKRYFHVEDYDDPRTVLVKVTGQVLTLDEALQETIPAFLALLEVLQEESPFRTLDPPHRRQRTLDALKRLLLRESQVQPLLLVFEDLHWIDTETQAFLDNLVESLPTAHLLLLVNYRPEYQHGWGSKTYYAQLRLDPLPPASADELLQALLGDDASLRPLKQLLIERTEGNPFFVEESVRSLVETRVLVGERCAYRLAQALPSIQVPTMVQAVLAARIDRLPLEEKRLLQTAAVIGTQVPFSLLQAVAELPDEALRLSLTHLQAAEFLYETRLFPELEYAFKHALTHEVAYSSLLQERRRTLHSRIVDAIERLYPDHLAEQVERLAHHAFRGEVWGKAVAYCRQAGVKAADRSAHQEAVAYFEQALVALKHLPEHRDRIEQDIDLRFSLRNSLWPLGQHRRISEYLREAEALAEALDDQRRLGWVSTYMTEDFWLMGSPDRAIEAGQRAFAIAKGLGDFTLEIVTNRYLAQSYHVVGNYRRAMDIMRQNVVFLEGELAYERFGTPVLVSVVSRTWLVWCLTELGDFAEGIARGEEGVRIAEAVDHPGTLVTAYCGVGLLDLRKGDLHKAIPALERVLELCQSWNILNWFPRVASVLGVVYALSGRVAEALPLLEQAVERAASMRRMAEQALRTAHLSEAYLLADRLEDASALARRALELSHQHKERGHEAWILRLLGELAAQREPPEVERSASYYRQALALAEELGMRPLVAHCHHGLGALYLKTGRREHARAELSAAIALYRSMEMTFWLPQAEAGLSQAG